MQVCLYAYTKYTRMLISIYKLAYCCFLCNTVVECCFNGPVILGLYGLPKSQRAKYGSISHSFTEYFYRMRSVALQCNFIAITCCYTTYMYLEKLVVGSPSEHFTVRFNH